MFNKIQEMPKKLCGVRLEQFGVASKTLALN